MEIKQVGRLAALHPEAIVDTASPRLIKQRWLVLHWVQLFFLPLAVVYAVTLGLYAALPFLAIPLAHVMVQRYFWSRGQIGEKFLTRT